MRIIITGRGVDLTDAIESYVSRKLNTLERFFSGIIQADVMLGKTTNHHHKGRIFFAECKLKVPGKDLFSRQDASSVYEALDLLRAQLERELKKRKVKLRGVEKKNKRTLRKSKEYTPQSDY